MREYSSGEVTPHQAVLGLLARGRTTVAALRSRLDREFPYANYAPNTASTAPRRLAGKAQVRLLRSGEDPSEDVYEITREGLALFEEWLYEVPSVPAPLRDTLQAKLAFIPPEGVRRLVDIIKILEDAAAHQYGVEHGKIRTISLGGVVDGNPELELQRIRHKYTATLWGQEAKRLSTLRKDLEEFSAKHKPGLERRSD